MKQIINGILLLDKPIHCTSQHVLQRAKRLFNAKKAGHTGCLDPLATGMLPICFGEATKFSQFLLNADKTYQVTAKLGIITNTYDSDGDVVSVKPVEGISAALLEKTIQLFLGEIDQVPPMFSAIKQNGQPLYKLARQGIEVERAARRIIINKIILDHFEDDQFSMSVDCSKGTYIRTLVYEIGLALGVGAHVTALRRTAVGAFKRQRMYTFTELETISQTAGHEGLLACLLPLEIAVSHLPCITLSKEEALHICQGKIVTLQTTTSETGTLARLITPLALFIGIGQTLPNHQLKAHRLLETTPNN